MRKHNRFSALLTMLSLLALAACAPTAAPTAAPPPPATADATADATAAPVQPTRPAATPEPAATAATAAAPAPAWDDRSIYRSGLVAAEQEILARLPDASVYHIDLRIADDLSRVTGRQQVRFTNAEAVALDEIYLRLFPNATGGEMTVGPGSVTVDGRPAETALAYGGTALRVPLASPLPPGGRVVLALDYVISVPVTLTTGYGLLSYVDGVLALDSPYAAIPAYDAEGWNVELPPENADLSFYDVSFYRVRVTAPADLVLVAAGVEVARAQEGTAQTVTFAAGPARDFFLAASADYSVARAQAGATRVNSYYTRPEGAVAAQRAADTAAAALAHYAARFGPYPYTEMDIAATPLLALGIEYPGIMGLTLRFYDPEQVVAGLPSQVAIESTTAHEMAHQWFYNLVGNDQVDEPWLDEALAQYATGLYYEDRYGADAAGRYRESWTSRWARVNRNEIPIGLPAAEYSAREYGAIVYGRGPFFLLALADRMGQPAFDRFLAGYAAAHRWGIARRADFEALAESTCACSLDDLFAAWVERR